MGMINRVVMNPIVLSLSTPCEAMKDDADVAFILYKKICLCPAVVPTPV